MLDNVEFYVKNDEYGFERLYNNSYELTGKYIVNFDNWLERNPEERRRLGVIRVEKTDRPDINENTHFAVSSIRMTGELEAVEEYHVIEKTEMMKLAGTTSSWLSGTGGFIIV